MSDADWLGFSVSGKVAPEIEKPAPEIPTEVTVTAAVPVEASVTVCVEAELTATLPKLRLDELTANAGFAAFNCRVTVGSVLPAIAERVTVWAVGTAEMVAVKPALVAPAATVTEDGTTTAELLLARIVV